MLDRAQISPEVLLEVRGLTKVFKPRKTLFQRKGSSPIRAVDDVSFEIRQGETLGLVGESGCGKSTVTRLLLGIHEPSAGTMRYRKKDGGTVDLDLSQAVGQFRVGWFDPRNGGQLTRGSVPSVAGGASRSVGLPPSAPEEDWLAMVSRIK